MMDGVEWGPSIRRSCFIVKTSGLTYSSLWQTSAPPQMAASSFLCWMSLWILGLPTVARSVCSSVSRFESGAVATYRWVWRMSRLHSDNETNTRRRIRAEPKSCLGLTAFRVRGELFESFCFTWSFCNSTLLSDPVSATQAFFNQ